jgi:hypothetical protein
MAGSTWTGSWTRSCRSARVADRRGASAIVAVMQIRDARACAGAPSRDALELRPVSHVVRMLILAIACHGEFRVKTRK